MKYSVILLVLLFTVSLLSAYSWSPWGPPNVPISKADWNIPAVLSNGSIGLNESNTWNYYTHSNLNVVDFTRYDSNSLIVLLGSGSNSDGVYFFNVNDHTFELMRWTMSPFFVKYCSSDSMFYVGGLDGLWKTPDGSQWTEVEIPGFGAVTDFAYQGSHFVVSKNEETWYSSDGGTVWNQSQTGTRRQGYRFDSEGVVYSYLKEGSYSDGIWISSDYGETWTVVIWAFNLSCIGPKFNNNLCFGCLNGTNDHLGVGMTVPGGDYITLNEGLPNLNINCMEMFDIINTPSFWVGTDNGAYFCTGFLEPIPIDDQVVNPASMMLKNYPNPFSKSTTICFNTPKNAKETRLEIYNIKGELVYSENANQQNNITWNGNSSTGIPTAAGIYLCKLVSQSKILTAKSIIRIK